MTSIGKLRRQQKELFEGKQDVPYEMSARMGRASDKALKVTTRLGYIYVRIGHDETLAQAYWTGPIRYNLTCFVGYKGTSTVFRVLRLDQNTYTMAGFQPIPEVDEHAATHMWPDPSDTTTEHRGSDPLFVSWRQILELRLGKHTSGSFIVRLDRALIESDGIMEWVVAQTLDLTNSVPASGARWVTVYLLPDGTVGRADGAVTTKALINVSDIHVPTFDHFRVGAVLLWDSQTQIRDDAGRRDIEDLRFPQVLSSAASGTVTPEVTTIATTPRWFVDGPLSVVDDAGGIWRIEQVFEVTAVTIYLHDTGTAGTTTIDVDYSPDSGANWTTLFPTQGDRPNIAGGAGSHVDTGTLAFATLLNVGTLLRMNIESAAVVARGLSVQLSGEEGAALIVSDMLMMGV